MNKLLWGIIPLIILLTGCAGSAQSVAGSTGIQPASVSGDMTLDQAIAEAAVRIDERIPSGSKVAPVIDHA